MQVKVRTWELKTPDCETLFLVLQGFSELILSIMLLFTFYPCNHNSCWHMKIKKFYRFFYRAQSFCMHKIRKVMWNITSDHCECSRNRVDSITLLILTKGSKELVLLSIIWCLIFTPWWRLKYRSLNINIRENILNIPGQW